MNKRQAYEEKLETQLKNWNLEFSVLQDMVGRVEPDARSELARAMSYLTEKRTIAITKLRRLKTSEEEEWEKLQEDTDAAWSNLGIAIKTVSQQLND